VVSGRLRSEPATTEQDYISVPGQGWIYGFAVTNSRRLAPITASVQSQMMVEELQRFLYPHTDVDCHDEIRIICEGKLLEVGPHSDLHSQPHLVTGSLNLDMLTCSSRREH
jgi:hypothetical protein